MATATDYLSSYLTPLADGLTAQQAKEILAIKLTAALIARVEELADKANTGALTAEERAEYEHYVEVDDVIGLLKARARSVVSSR